MTRARTNRRASCTETRTASARIDIYDPSSVRRIFHERAGPRSVDRQYFPREISKSDPRHRRNVSLSFFHSFSIFPLFFSPIISPIFLFPLVYRASIETLSIPYFIFNSRLIIWLIRFVSIRIPSYSSVVPCFISHSIFSLASRQLVRLISIETGWRKKKRKKDRRTNQRSL